ncbi:MAG: hypothetical protein ACXWP6_14445 [Ktedonobacterales bacterium]
MSRLSSTIPRPRRAVIEGSRRWAIHVLEFGVFALALWGTQLLSIHLWLLPNGDVDEYYQYAVDFWTTYPIFHRLPVEYPPLAIVPFSLTLLPQVPLYHTVYAIWMGLLVLLGYAGILRYGGRGRALVYAGYLLLGTAATLLARFDIVPALVTLAALWATERRRFGYAYVLLAAGVLLKLYPVFLVPVVLVAHWQAAMERARTEEGPGAEPPDLAALPWRRAPFVAVRRVCGSYPFRRVARGAMLCGGLVLLGFTGAFLLNPTGALSNFLYAGQRPLQVESTPASILWLGTLAGIPAGPDYSFTSLNYVGVLDGALKPLSALALVGGCLWVYWRQYCGRLTVGRAFAGVLCVVLVTNKLFSPQYLVWVLPVVAYVEGFDLIWVAICFLTWLDFPIMYQWRHPIQTVTFTTEFMPVLALRNGLLLWATLRVIIRPKPVHASADDATPANVSEAAAASECAGSTAAGAKATEPRDERGDAAPALTP